MPFAHLIPLATLASLAQAPVPATLQVDIDGVRNAKGVFHICLTAQPKSFPDCSKDPSATKMTVPAHSRSVQLKAPSAGRYALTLFHDENGNQRLDTMLGIPREGFGFSRNPVVRFGAPKFRQVEFQLAAGNNRQWVRLQYML